MRSLERNAVPVYYAAYLGDTELLDAQGRLTGEHGPSYRNPTAMRANVSIATGNAFQHPFGTFADYDKVLVFDLFAKLPTWDSIEAVTWDTLEGANWDTVDPNAITETTLFWIDSPPEIATDGTTTTPHDYIVKRVSRSLNSVSVAVKRVPNG